MAFGRQPLQDAAARVQLAAAHRDREGRKGLLQPAQPAQRVGVQQGTRLLLLPLLCRAVSRHLPEHLRRGKHTLLGLVIARRHNRGQFRVEAQVKVHFQAAGAEAAVAVVVGPPHVRRRKGRHAMVVVAVAEAHPVQRRLERKARPVVQRAAVELGRRDDPPLAVARHPQAAAAPPATHLREFAVQMVEVVRGVGRRRDLQLKDVRLHIKVAVPQQTCLVEPGHGRRRVHAGRVQKVDRHAGVHHDGVKALAKGKRQSARPQVQGVIQLEGRHATRQRHVAPRREKDGHRVRCRGRGARLDNGNGAMQAQAIGL